MIALIVKVVFWCVISTLMACVEIESEGKYGWAYKMPTWYRTRGVVARIFGLLLAGKPLTGYHLMLFPLPLLIVHAHFVMGVEWSVVAEAEALGLYFVWNTFWDYFWFVLNPYYDGKFTRKQVWWHAKHPWFLGLFPMDYLWAILASVVVVGAGSWHVGSWQSLVHHGYLFAGFVVYTSLLWAAAPFYHRWYRRMRNPLTDDRDKVDIFYP